MLNEEINWHLNKHIWKAIYKAYPFLHSGIDCGPGWFGLILYALEIIKEYNEKENGRMKVIDIKEKWGSLCIYTDVRPDSVWNVLRKIEKESEGICEVCGIPGKNEKRNGWYKTLCDIHAEQYLRETSPREDDILI